MTNRRRSDRLIITLPPDVIDRLRTRGARSDKTHGPYNYTQQLTRTLELYESVVVKSDPRETRDLPEEHYDMVLDLILDPQRLESSTSITSATTSPSCRATPSAPAP